MTFLLLSSYWQYCTNHYKSLVGTFTKYITRHYTMVCKMEFYPVLLANWFHSGDEQFSHINSNCVAKTYEPIIILYHVSND
jgi:hypothetical protein